MRTLVIASQKGGVGKTTIAGHLGVMAESQGAGPVALIDTDPQGSLSSWWNERQAEAPAFASVDIANLPGHLKHWADHAWMWPPDSNLRHWCDRS